MIQHLNSRKKTYSTNQRRPWRKFKNFIVPVHISLNIQKKFLEDYVVNFLEKFTESFVLIAKIPLCIQVIYWRLWTPEQPVLQPKAILIWTDLNQNLIKAMWSDFISAA